MATPPALTMARNAVPPGPRAPCGVSRPSTGKKSDPHLQIAAARAAYRVDDPRNLAGDIECAGARFLGGEHELGAKFVERLGHRLDCFGVQLSTLVSVSRAEPNEPSRRGE